jgi:hypothetical protein
MKIALFVASLITACSLVASAADQPAVAKTKFTVVKVIDRDDKETFEVLESPALTALADEIKIEERLFDRAMALTEKAWRTDESTKAKSFPRSAIGHRSCETVGTPYTSREAAEKALTALEEKKTRAEENRAESEKKREATRRKVAQNNSNSSYTPKKRDNKQAEAEKKGLEDSARSIFATKLAELKSGKHDVKDAPAAAPEQPAGVKPDPKAAGAAVIKK